MNSNIIAQTHLLIIILFFAACGDKDNTTQSCSSDFDQITLFTNVADQLIIPGYTDLKTKTDNFQTSLIDFLNDPSENTLLVVRTQFQATYLSFQVVYQYEFGPAADVFLRSSINNFPPNIEKISINANSGIADLEADSSAYARGLPALDYLLYGVAESDSEIIATLSEGNYVNYLTAITNDLVNKVSATTTGWNTYRATFVERTGTASDGSLSLIINGLNQAYEIIKNEKIGTPSGILTTGFTNPDKVEAFYSGISLDLAKIALESSQNLYEGGSGIGLDDYLIAIEAKKGDGSDLNEAILSQFAAAINTTNVLEAKLSDAVDNDSEAVLNAYDEIRKQLVNIKTDMPAALCVSITYTDNPSDSD